MSLNELKKRIKKNEGYSQSPYKDQLGFYTIGYGHLIKKNELKLFNKKYNKKYYKNLFEKDFRKSLNEYKKLFNRKKHNKKDQELLIEMLYQLGTKGVSKFKKMLSYIDKKEKFMTCLEMMDSLWYKQTPKRVENLINNYIAD